MRKNRDAVMITVLAIVVLTFIIAGIRNVCVMVGAASAVTEEKIEPVYPPEERVHFIPVEETDPHDEIDISCQVVDDTEEDTDKATEVEEPELLSETDQHNIELLACAIYQEAGSDAVCDECRYRVGDVILNRVDSEYFPDTIEGVLTQNRQYGLFYVTGVVWPERASNVNEAAAVERAYEVATDILVNGNHGDLYGKGYIWQAEFIQGDEYVYCDGIYFCR